MTTCTVLAAQDNPPRFELGAVLSAANGTDLGQDPPFGAGARFSVNLQRYIGVEAELSRQATAAGSTEIDSTFTLKGTYRAEQHRWLGFAGVNFFGLLGPALINRTVEIPDPNNPPYCFECTALSRQTAKMLVYGGGFEIVPSRPVALRFDVTHGSFTEVPAFSSFEETIDRTYLKASIVWRFH